MGINRRKFNPSVYDGKFSVWASALLPANVVSDSYGQHISICEEWSWPPR
jgi:hypothetical protein